MTKVTIIGEKPKTYKYSGIRFTKRLDTACKVVDHGVSTMLSQPCDYGHIELICRDYYNTAQYGEPSLDLMFAYDMKRSAGVLYMGYFNDGVVAPLLTRSNEWTPGQV